MKTRPLRSEAASTLVVVISVLATLMVVVGVAAEYTYTVQRHVQRSNTLQNAVAVGDSCIEILFANWRQTCSATANVNTPQTTSAFAAIPTPAPPQLGLATATVKRGTSYDPNNDEYASDFTISNYKVVATTAEWTALASANVTPEPMIGPLPTATAAAGATTSLIYNYVASADVTLPALGKNKNVVARVRRVFQKMQITPWNFAIFYVDPLEIHPGPDFTITGWVHTNSDLYTGHDTLTFADKVTYASDWFVGFKPGETEHSSETPAAPNYPSSLPPARDQALQPFGLDSTAIFFPNDANPNNDSYHELIEQSVAGNPDPLAGLRYYDQAAIRVSIDSSNNLTIKKLNGNTVSSLSSGNDLKLYNAITNAITTNQPIYDTREAASVRLATLDIGLIVTSLTNSSSSSTHIDSTLWNGIIYVTDTSYNASSPSTTRRGIRLKNGKILPSGGLTVASANPVYIQGDFNTGYAPPSNSTDPTMPEGTTTSGGSTRYNRQAASVLADAVNILSNNWNDTNAQSVDPLSSRRATNTTVNTAIVAGIVPSSPVGGDGKYGGGAENFPRFLEDWSDIKFVYYGSMVELFNSKQATGEWGMSNVYDAPTRKWYYDTNFKFNSPPGTLMIHSYIKGKWSVL